MPRLRMETQNLIQVNGTLTISIDNNVFAPYGQFLKASPHPQ